MREIRTFEMEGHEGATAWRIESPLVLTVSAGQLWLTIEHDSEDYWLEAGQSFALPAGVRAWVGASRGTVRMTVARADEHQPSIKPPGRGWLPRWLQPA